MNIIFKKLLNFKKLRFFSMSKNKKGQTKNENKVYNKA